MTALQLNTKKLEIIEMLIGISDEKILAQISSLIRKSLENPSEHIPGLAYTHEERIAAVREGMEDIKAGRVGTDEEAFKPYEQWL